MDASEDGLIVAVGAISANNARVYQWNGVNWAQMGTTIPGENGGDQFGGSVSLSNDGLTLAVGGTGNDSSGNERGHVRVYQWDGADWDQLGLDIEGESGGDQSGWSVDLSRSTGLKVAIGGIFNDGNGSNSGHVRIYEWDGLAWL